MSIPRTSTQSKSSLETASTAVNAPDAEPGHTAIELDFSGSIPTNNKLPTMETLKKIENYSVLDEDGKAVPFKNLYTGPNVARRMLLIFIRHFFCGNCQEYIRTLTASITPTSLLSLPTPTFIAIIGHGSPSLIPMYRSQTSTPFPIYADPTKNLYDALGMTRTLNLGTRPEYQRKELWELVLQSFVVSLKMLKGGGALKGGDYHQVGGEFLFEPLENTEFDSPDTTPSEEKAAAFGAVGRKDTRGEQGMLEMGKVEEKRVTWCHRMRNTRDHAEIPEVREVLGLDVNGDGGVVPDGVNAKRWGDALLKRKGTGLTVGSSASISASEIEEDKGKGVGKKEKRISVLRRGKKVVKLEDEI